MFRTPVWKRLVSQIWYPLNLKNLSTVDKVQSVDMQGEEEEEEERRLKWYRSSPNCLSIE